MKVSRGMGDIMPSKMPKGVKKARRDNTDFTQFAKGGKVSNNVTTTKGGTAAAMAKKLLAKPGSLTASDMYSAGGKTKKVRK